MMRPCRAEALDVGERGMRHVIDAGQIGREHARPQIAGLVLRNGALGASPALLTRMAIWPNASRARASPAIDGFASVTSNPSRTSAAPSGSAPGDFAQRLRAPPGKVTRAPAPDKRPGDRSADAGARAGNERMAT